MLYGARRHGMVRVKPWSAFGIRGTPRPRWRGLLLLALTVVPVHAHAWSDAGDVRLTAELGGAALQRPEQSPRWRLGGGLAAALGVTSLAQLQLLVDHRRTVQPDAGDTATSVLAATFVYGIERLWLTPYFEAGLAYVVAQPRLDAGVIVPTAAAGLDADLSDRLFVGANVRYYPIFSTGLLQNPAYVVASARLGLVLPALRVGAR